MFKFLGECYDCGRRFRKKTLEILVDDRNRPYHKRCARRYNKATGGSLILVLACVFPQFLLICRTPVMWHEGDDVRSIRFYPTRTKEWTEEERLRILGTVCDALGRA